MGLSVKQLRWLTLACKNIFVYLCEQFCSLFQCLVFSFLPSMHKFSTFFKESKLVKLNHDDCHRDDCQTV